MTYLEKYLAAAGKVAPKDIKGIIKDHCPHQLIPDVTISHRPDYCDENANFDTCKECWSREIPETGMTAFEQAGITALKETEKLLEELKEGRKTVNEVREACGMPRIEDNSLEMMVKTKLSETCSDATPRILDSGDRTKFESGAVRDMRVGKGRCDLLPLDVVVDYIDHVSHSGFDMVLLKIYHFQETSNNSFLHDALVVFTEQHWECDHTMLLETAIHFEEGAKKYGDNNWRKGIPVNVYIDSALRHYFKFLRGDKDEPHDRAFCWNILCAIWTAKHMPELNPYGKKVEER